MCWKATWARSPETWFHHFNERKLEHMSCLHHMWIEALITKWLQTQQSFPAPCIKSPSSPALALNMLENSSFPRVPIGSLLRQNLLQNWQVLLHPLGVWVSPPFHWPETPLKGSDHTDVLLSLHWAWHQSLHTLCTQRILERSLLG
jgi:hypothetical protein